GISLHSYCHGECCDQLEPPVSCLVLGTVLLTKLLRLWSPRLSNKLVYWYASETPDSVSLKREVSDIKQQLQHVNMMDNFADHARLQRRINQKDRELQVKEKGQVTVDEAECRVEWREFIVNIDNAYWCRHVESSETSCHFPH
ncbi:guided entry of tail-anchored proteins factor 1-like, partial [Halichondria panicea]|uniref:guided entry of tail-anchored proteins factor 1-like n=1 Tax=Halichondria panicea TaxID=6063 RepID=UPI00312B3E08